VADQVLEKLKLCVYLLQTVRKQKDEPVEQYYKEWGTYIDTLPFNELDGFIQLMSEKEQENLTGSPMLNKVALALERLEEYYYVLCKRAKGFEQFSFGDFVEVWTIISSRAFDLTIGGRE
jgi:23S rRNA pseudoU1915 N3-methylase RlmH